MPFVGLVHNGRSDRDPVWPRWPWRQLVTVASPKLFVAMARVNIGVCALSGYAQNTTCSSAVCGRERVSAIALVPEPNTQKQNKRFIGGTGFYAGTVPVPECGHRWLRFAREFYISAKRKTGLFIDDGA